MLNIYNKFTHPEELTDFGSDQHVKLALRTFIEKPYKLTDADKKVLTSHKNEFLKLDDPAMLFKFAWRILNDRWPEAEHIIMRDPKSAARYALDVINYEKPNPPIRWKEAEDSIKQDPWGAYSYAHYILQRKWPEAEQYIKQDDTWWEMYNIVFNNEA
jgi:hypothetical protein